MYKIGLPRNYQEDNMKRALSLIMAIVTCLSCCVLLASCGHECEWAADWSKDATHHWKACTDAECAEVNEKAEHTWDAGTAIATGTQFTCSVCGQTKTEGNGGGQGSEPSPYEVSAENWASAFELGTNFVLTVKVTDPTARTQVTNQTRNGGQLSMVNSVIAPAGNETKLFEMYYYQEGDVLYMYDQYEDDNDEPTWTRGPVPSNSGMSFDDLLIGDQIFAADMIARSNYTYNAETNVYTSPDKTEGGVTASNITLSFLNGKVVKLAYAITQDGATASYEITVSHGNAAVVYPVVNATVDADGFRSALTYGTENFKIQHIVEGGGNKWDNRIGFYGDRVSVDSWYNESYNSIFYLYDDGVYTKYDKENNYVEEESSKAEFESYKGYLLHDLLTFDKFTYDAVLQAYRAESIPTTGMEMKNVIVFIKSGELEAITYTTVDPDDGTVYSHMLQYSLENSTPIIPSPNPGL